MFDIHYDDWNRKKIKKIISHFNHKFLYMKRILDLGCGHGEISEALARMGADVLACDARQQNLDIVKKKYPHLKTIRADLEVEWPFTSKFDIIICSSLICHTKNYDKLLENICRFGKHVVLETEVIDSLDPTIISTIFEDTNIDDLSYSGTGTLLTAAYIQNKISSIGGSFKRIDDISLNSGNYVYDWKEVNGGNRRYGNRRFWFVKMDEHLLKKFESDKAIRDAEEKLHQRQIEQEQNILSNDHIIHYQRNRSPKPVLNNEAIINNRRGKIINPAPNQIFNQIPQLTKFKIGVCISGHMRTFDKCYPSFINNILKQFQNSSTDVFIHTWANMGSPSSKDSSDVPVVNQLTNDRIKEIATLINPIEIKIEDYGKCLNLFERKNQDCKLQPGDGKWLFNENLIGYLSQTYSMKQSLILLEDYEKKNNISYDIIIRLRPDLQFTRPIRINSDINNIIYLPNIGSYYSDGINDQFSVGNAKFMKIYLSMFDSIEEYSKNRSCVIRPETLLRHHLLKNNVIMREEPIFFDVVRPDGRIMQQGKSHQNWIRRK